MDLMYSVAEAVIIAFLVGAMLGAVVAIHLQSRKSHAADENVGGELKVKVKANRRDYL